MKQETLPPTITSHKVSRPGSWKVRLVNIFNLLVILFHLKWKWMIVCLKPKIWALRLEVMDWARCNMGVCSTDHKAHKDKFILWIHINIMDPSMQRAACLSLDPEMIYSIRCTESLMVLPPGALTVTRFISLWDSSGISLVSVVFRAVQSYCTWTALVREFLDFLLQFAN